MKKILLVAMTLIATASFAQMRNDLSAGKKTDLVAFNSAQDSVAYICLGNTTPFDSYLRVYMYVIARTTTPDGENVLAATGMGGVGRYIKVPQPQSDWSQSNTTEPDYIKNKPTGSTGTYGIVTTTNGVVSSGKKSEIATVTSNASGIVTVTYINTYSVVPNIQPSMVLGATNKYTITPITSTTTGCTYKVEVRTDIAGLLPTYAAVNNQAVDFIITEK